MIAKYFSFYLFLSQVNFLLIIVSPLCDIAGFAEKQRQAF